MGYSRNTVLTGLPMNIHSVKLSYKPLTRSTACFSLVGVSISMIIGRTLRLRRGKLWLPSKEQLLNTFRNRLWAFAVLKRFQFNIIYFTWNLHRWGNGINEMLDVQFELIVFYGEEQVRNSMVTIFKIFGYVLPSRQWRQLPVSCFPFDFLSKVFVLFFV